MWRRITRNSAENGKGESLYSNLDEDGLTRVYHTTADGTTLTEAEFQYSETANNHIKLLVDCYNNKLLDSLNLEKNKNAQLLIATNNLIEYYQKFMSGQGNYDEFEDVLYDSHAEGFDEDSLVFCNHILWLLYLRKRTLEKLVAENDE